MQLQRNWQQRFSSTWHQLHQFCLPVGQSWCKYLWKHYLPVVQSHQKILSTSQPPVGSWGVGLVTPRLTTAPPPLALTTAIRMNGLKRNETVSQANRPVLTSWPLSVRRLPVCLCLCLCLCLPLSPSSPLSKSTLPRSISSDWISKLESSNLSHQNWCLICSDDRNILLSTYQISTHPLTYPPPTRLRTLFTQLRRFCAWWRFGDGTMDGVGYKGEGVIIL